MDLQPWNRLHGRLSGALVGITQKRNSETQLRNATPNRIVIHIGPDLSIWITLLHPYVSYCLIVLVVLALTYVSLLLYPSLYCLTLVPFRMYLTMTLLTRLMFRLT